MRRVSFLPFLFFMFLPIVIVEKYMPTSIIATTTVVLSVYFSILIMVLTYKINVKFFIENLINVITYFVVIFGLIFIGDTFRSISNFSVFFISMTLITILLWLLGRKILEKFNIPTSDAYKYVVKNKEISILTFFMFSGLFIILSSFLWDMVMIRMNSILLLVLVMASIGAIIFISWILSKSILQKFNVFEKQGNLHEQDS